MLLTRTDSLPSPLNEELSILLRSLGKRATVLLSRENAHWKEEVMNCGVKVVVNNSVDKDFAILVRSTRM